MLIWVQYNQSSKFSFLKDKNDINFSDSVLLNLKFYIDGVEHPWIEEDRFDFIFTRDLTP